MIGLTRVWAKVRPFGTELADMRLGGGRLSAVGVAIGTDPVPYRLDHELSTVRRYVTARLVARSQGHGWRRGFELERAATGTWSCRTEAEGMAVLAAPGGDLNTVAGAFDCDLALSPLTNSITASTRPAGRWTS